jgi:hypothetical protein
VTARRLAVQPDSILDDAAMLAETTSTQLFPEQISAMLRNVVNRHLTKLDRIVLAAKTVAGFEVG